jgi:hypothetical protein
MSRVWQDSFKQSDDRLVAHGRGLRTVFVHPAAKFCFNPSLYRYSGADGATLARVAGDLYFDHDFHLVVRERLLCHRLPIMIDSYGYELWRGEEKLYWYDSQPHPDDSELEKTHPHHKHIPPNIEHHRIPAPDMSFTQPNLPVLIREIEQLIENVDEPPLTT